MPFKIFFSPEGREDVWQISGDIRKRIINAIESKLTEQPFLYGERLRKSPAGYWKLRVGKYRVVFFIERQEVHIVVVKHCSEVYDIALRRLKDR